MYGLDWHYVDVVQDTPFAVFGLGNVQYEHFNATGKRVFKHLKTIGGNPLVKLGLGDDDADIADDFAVWLEQLVAAIESAGLLEASQPENGVVATDASYEVDCLDFSSEHCADVLQGYIMGSSQAKAPSMLQVKTVRELHGTASDRSCVHVELALGKCLPSFLRYLLHACTAMPSSCHLDAAPVQARA